MKILIVAATSFEIEPLRRHLSYWIPSGPDEFTKGSLRVKVLITGIGVTATAWALANKTAIEKPDLAINMGIAGAFDRSLSLGQVVNVSTEQFGDLGIEQADGTFADLFEASLSDANTFPVLNGQLLNPQGLQADFLPAVKGITVSKVHGNEDTIARFRAKYPEAQVESMEGAAFFYSCLMGGIPFLEIRAISNYVEKRDRANWKMRESVDNLNGVVVEMLGTLASE